MILDVDTQALRTAAQKFSSLSDEYTTVYTRLMNAAQTMGDAWNSADNQAFVEQISGFCEELKAMASHLQQGSLALNQQAQNYEDTRNNNITAAKQLAN